MADLIMLGLLVATTVLFSALTLDEVTSRRSIRRSNRTSLDAVSKVAKQPAIESVKDHQGREAA